METKMREPLNTSCFIRSFSLTFRRIIPISLDITRSSRFISQVVVIFWFFMFPFSSSTRMSCRRILIRQTKRTFSRTSKEFLLRVRSDNSAWTPRVLQFFHKTTVRRRSFQRSQLRIWTFDPVWYARVLIRNEGSTLKTDARRNEHRRWTESRSWLFRFRLETFYSDPESSAGEVKTWQRDPTAFSLGQFVRRHWTSSNLMYHEGGS